MPVYLSIQRPLRLSFDPYDEETWAEGIERAKDKGYDGIVYPNAVEGGESWVAFSPTQIKSAIGNRGTFDPEDPNIMHNPRRRAAPRRALRFVRPPRRVVRRNGLGMERSVTPSPAVAAFVKEWNARDMDTVFADMGVRVDVGLEGGDYIELEMIEALRPGRGNGGRALRALLDLVDKHNLGVTLTAMPFHRYDAEGNPLPGLDDLVRIYQRFGFRLEEGQDEDEDEEPESYHMTRSPRRSRRNPSLGSVVLKGPESGAPRAVVYVDGKEVGYAQLTRIQGLNDPDNPVWECEHEIRTLRQRVGPSTLWVMWRAYLDDEHQNKGYGVAMYEALLRGMHAQYNKPAIIFPEECVDGGRTSNAAMRVWASLSRRWESEGRAVASIPLTPNPRR
jgi:GNAT superfamily N-acetyltransferase